MDTKQKNNLETEIKIKAIKKFVLENKKEKVVNLTESIPVPDLSFYVSKWESKTFLAFFNLLDYQLASEILYHLPRKQITKLIQNSSLELLRHLFEELYIDQIIEILENQTPPITEKVFSVLGSDEIAKIKEILKFDKNSAGYHMSVDYVKVNEMFNVRTALADIKRQVSENDSEIAGFIFVVDDKNILKGIVRSEKLISSSGFELIMNIMDDTPQVQTRDSLENVKQTISKYEQSFLPVVNRDNRLLGVIGAEDFMSNIVTISDSDMMEGGVVNRVNKPYSQQTARDLFRNRIFWILVLLIVGTLSQMLVIGFQLIWQNAGIWSYNQSSGAATALTSSIITLALTTSLSVASSINDASGNSGAQSSTTILRAIATNDIDSSMFRMVLFKELKASILIGLTVSVTSLARMWIVWGVMGQLSSITNGFDFFWYFIISLIAAFSFFAAILIGNLVGALLPMLADRFNRDGALFSGPVQTTIVDIITFTVYLSLTTIVFVLSKDFINSHDSFSAIVSMQHIVNCALLI